MKHSHFVGGMLDGGNYPRPGATFHPERWFVWKDDGTTHFGLSAPRVACAVHIYDLDKSADAYVFAGALQ